jgi:hypothetical protein
VAGFSIGHARADFGGRFDPAEALADFAVAALAFEQD